MVKRTRIFADGADLASIERFAVDVAVSGFTTNPTLMRKVGIANYAQFAADVIAIARGKSISFEVFADDMDGMERQARIISKWAPNVLVKIPVTNTLGASTCELIGKLTAAGVKVNVTAITTLDQAARAVDAIAKFGSVVSVFAGRIADTGVDPEPIVRDIVRYAEESDGRPEVLWASTREVFNIVQADRCGCDIITMTPEQIVKLSLFGRDLAAYSLDTVKQFHNDAKGLVL